MEHFTFFTIRGFVENNTKLTVKSAHDGDDYSWGFLAEHA